mmetsp:Transcript_11438/g.17055  ORF Transcript_11438/g.17055 Transcript_11438/m.17055 type:complete len:164 (-) Transcript_11438:2603-3094(-)
MSKLSEIPATDKSSSSDTGSRPRSSVISGISRFVSTRFGPSRVARNKWQSTVASTPSPETTSPQGSRSSRDPSIDELLDMNTLDEDYEKALIQVFGDNNTDINDEEHLMDASHDDVHDIVDIHDIEGDFKEEESSIEDILAVFESEKPPLPSASANSRYGMTH